MAQDIICFISDICLLHIIAKEGNERRIIGNLKNFFFFLRLSHKYPQYLFNTRLVYCLLLFLVIPVYCDCNKKGESKWLYKRWRSYNNLIMWLEHIVGMVERRLGF